ncbi:MULTISPECIES: ASCH domain-containing protein [Nocardiaceae]|uniref:ASCH domain-containing protein n=1 Tax=Rhodococcoides corynebacterioides TaxID=53972 RepID=A0ABS2KNM7_9NOCA|nr:MULTISPECIES: ASCH domain-containing protein [Rhodococcus]MBM7413542.1 hypothetical protein [Rhodococcus corynebacterioides]MBP1116005.1 hypothetical protein [Rhodococcus sp. PvP016]
MLIRLAIAEAIAAGTIRVQYRRWATRRVKPGTWIHTPAGLIVVDAITECDPDSLTDDDARAAGESSISALRKGFRGADGDPVWRVDVSFGGGEAGGRPDRGGEAGGRPDRGGEAGGRPDRGGEAGGRPDRGGKAGGRPDRGGEAGGRPDRGEVPRVGLRADDDLSDDDVAALTTKLDRMDKRADSPWAWRTLELIRDHPAVLAADLGAVLGLERDVFKPRVRRLKALGLTESLKVGYQLSLRGEKLLDIRRSDR